MTKQTWKIGGRTMSHDQVLKYRSSLIGKELKPTNEPENNTFDMRNSVEVELEKLEEKRAELSEKMNGDFNVLTNEERAEYKELGKQIKKFKKQLGK